MPSFLYTCVFVPSPHPCAPSIMWVLESNLEFQFIRLDGKCPYPLSHLASSGWPRFCFLKTQLIFFYQTLINRSTCNLNFTNAHTLPESKDLKLSQACPLPLNRWWWHMHQYLKQMPILPGGFFFFWKSHYIAQATLKFMILLPQLPKQQNYRWRPPCPVAGKIHEHKHFSVFIILWRRSL